MGAMIRRWLRAWLGVETVCNDIKALSSHVSDLEANSDEHRHDIQALKYRRELKEQKQERAQVVDWEQQMQQYAANPDNFKEN